MPISRIETNSIEPSQTLTTPIIATTMGVGGATPSTSGSGITFPATQSASTNANTLDDYEEGTWTPRVQGTGGANTGQTGTFSGTYTKIGRIVTVYFNVALTAKGTFSGSGALIGNMPFTAAGSTPHSPVYWDALATSWINVMAQCRGTTNQAYLVGRNSAGTSVSYFADGGTDIGNTTTLLGCITYEVA
jgi:hypothetical protein